MLAAQPTQGSSAGNRARSESSSSTGQASGTAMLTAARHAVLLMDAAEISRAQIAMLSFSSAEGCRFHFLAIMSGSSKCIMNAHAPMITLIPRPGSLHAIAIGQ